MKEKVKFITCIHNFLVLFVKNCYIQRKKSLTNFLAAMTLLTADDLNIEAHSIKIDIFLIYAYFI